jgi:D-sedoheptulose 7-phosphate isomerase
MNNVDRIFAAHGEAAQFAEGYTAYFGTLLQGLDGNAVARVIAAMVQARERGKTIFFIGNGGSAATASHFANDVAIGTRCASKPFRAISLTDNQAIITAIANDDGYEHIFVKQLEVLMQPGDVLVAISASGNSPNLVAAVEYARARGNHTIGFTGFDGGKLKQRCSDFIHVPTERGEYGPVEAVHAFLVHLIGNYLLQLVKREGSGA